MQKVGMCNKKNIYIYIYSAVKLIAINRIQNKSFFYIIYVCTCYLLCIYK